MITLDSALSPSGLRLAKKKILKGRLTLKNPETNLERGVRPMVTQKIKGKNSSAQHQAENWCRVCSLAFVRAVKYFPMRKKS
jgi:hypothetical protein